MLCQNCSSLALKIFLSKEGTSLKGALITVLAVYSDRWRATHPALEHDRAAEVFLADGTSVVVVKQVLLSRRHPVHLGGRGEGGGS